ncbi:MAG: extracellular solute-binding protein [Candidatus Curtissbacteria bacterium]
MPALKRILQVTVVVLTSLVLTACSMLPGGDKDKEVTIRVWGLWESPTVMSQIIADYKKTKPNVTVIYEKKSPQQYRESIENQIQSGRGPDVFVFHNTWTPMLKEELAQVPTSVISGADFSKSYYPTAATDLKSPDKKLVGIPLEIDGLALYYNTDIFTAAGIANPPATWPELAQAAAQVTVKDTAGNIKTAGVALGTASNIDHFSDILGLMIMQNRGDLRSPTDKSSSDALDYYVNFAKDTNRVWDETMPSSTVAFAGGNLAMYFAPSWRAIEIKNANPLLNFKTVPVPQLKLDEQNVGWATYWAVGVSAKSPAQDAAWDFVKYLSQEQTLIKLYTLASQSPGRIFGEPYPKVSMASKLTADPIVGAFVTSAPYMRSFPMASFTWDNGINDQIIKAYEDAINATISGTSSQTALATTAKNVQNILDRYTTPASR